MYEIQNDDSSSVIKRKQKKK